MSFGLVDAHLSSNEFFSFIILKLQFPSKASRSALPRFHKCPWPAQAAWESWVTVFPTPQLCPGSQTAQGYTSCSRVLGLLDAFTITDTIGPADVLAGRVSSMFKYCPLCPVLRPFRTPFKKKKKNPRLSSRDRAQWFVRWDHLRNIKAEKERMAKEEKQ